MSFSLILLDLQILASLAYYYQFGFPLNIEELSSRLVSKKVVLDFLKEDPGFLESEFGACGELSNLEDLEAEPIGLSVLSACLKLLVKAGLVEEVQGSFYVLNSSQFQDAISSGSIKSRKKLRDNSAKIKTSGLGLLKACIWIPWVRAVGITGSVAVEGAAVKDDLDLVVVVTRNRLWLTRFLLLLLAVVLGKKKLPWQSGHDSWCFNLWLSDDCEDCCSMEKGEEESLFEGGLSLSAEKRNLYTAFESAQIDWWWQRFGVEQRFLSQNEWLKEFLCFKCLNNEFQCDDVSDAGGIFLKGFWSCLSGIFGFANRLILKISKKHLHRKNGIPLSNLRLNQAFLHDDQSYQQYIKSWNDLFGQVVVQIRKEPC